MPFVNGKYYMNPSYGRGVENARDRSRYSKLPLHLKPDPPEAPADQLYAQLAADPQSQTQKAGTHWVTINHRHVLIREKDGKSTATDETTKINKIYNEFSGLRPKGGLTTADDLNRARRNAAHVYDNVHGKQFQGSPRLGSGDARDVRIPGTPAAQGHQATKDAIASAAQEPDTTENANHVYIYDPAAIHSGQVHAPDWVTRGETTTIAGPFINESGGGDLPKGDQVFIITVNDRNMRHPN